MKFGVVGIEKRALKEYLPLYFSMRDSGDFYFAVQDEKIEQALMQKYRLSHLYHNLQQLLDLGIDACFIHGSTPAHFELARKCLENGVHVFIDRPVGESLTELRQLQNLALNHRQILMLGFNRRFAPLVDDLKQVKHKRLLMITKNYNNLKLGTATAIDEIFIHLIDTAIYLIDEPIKQCNSQIRKNQNGMLDTAVMQLETEYSTAWLALDAHSNADDEQIQLTSDRGHYILNDLQELEIQNQLIKQVSTSKKWSEPAELCGFYQMVRSFIQAVESKTSTKLKQKNICLSHRLCAQMLKSAKQK
ncbi:Gfo/Idh/MocA family protein [Liquorilactobacillus vini]|uniref:Oxidoreductase n=2 Tax=Liquorilactobacillus vini TaxID=238015 RepID=A0A0R2CMP7_9LACO|nr:Gfo/Idh/MocA family oxidoreductase [Liquorilactobacillus vini]KRM89596.1 oxidoreductase [Liquorilactobacillus vini DSM 20605]